MKQFTWQSIAGRYRKFIDNRKAVDGVWKELADWINSEIINDEIKIAQEFMKPLPTDLVEEFKSDVHQKEIQ